MFKVIGIILLILSINFLLTLLGRGIVLYIPTQKTNGKVADIITRHRISRVPKEVCGYKRYHRMDIHEKFAIVEFYDEYSKCIAESMFPIVPFEMKVGDNVTVFYRKNKRKVYVKKY